MLEQPFDRSLQVESGIVFTRQAPAFRPLHHEEVEVVHRAGRPRGQVHELERPVVRVLDKGSLIDKVDREGRVVARITRQRQDSMTFSSGIASCSSASADHSARAVQQFGKAWLTREIDTQYERVDEEANEALRLDLIAPDDLGSHRNVCGAGIAVEQRHQSRVGQHEQRATIAACDRGKSVRQVRSSSWDWIAPEDP